MLASLKVPQPQNEKRDFNMLASLQVPQPPSKKQHNLVSLQVPQPPPKKKDFGMLLSLSLSAPSPSEKKHDFGMLASLSSKRDIGPVLPDPQRKPSMQITRPAEEGTSHIGTYLPMGEEETSSSSPKKRGEFRITRLYMHLTLVQEGWKFGDRAPSPINSEQSDVPSPMVEIGNADEIVCLTIRMPCSC